MTPDQAAHSGAFRIPRRSPQAAAEATERLARLPDGTDERFVGYGVIGLTWSSGHVLGLRRWPASSIGPAYTSIWHRTPNGQWQLYSDAKEQQSCSRYISRMVSASRVSPIRLTWLTPHRLLITVDAEGLVWELAFHSTLATLALGIARAWMSETVAASDAMLRAFELAAPLTLGTGQVKLRGLMPNGQRFRVVPKLMWKVSESTASIRGESLGRPARLHETVRLGDFIVPQSGVLAFATSRFR